MDAQTHAVQISGLRTSSFCGGTECIEVGRGDGETIVFRMGGVISKVTPTEFAAFLKGIKCGEFDDLTGAL